MNEPSVVFAPIAMQQPAYYCELFTFAFPIFLFTAYIIGSIPFGLIITKLAGKGDIRTIGAGNIGTTNVLRTGSKPLAALTLLCDAGKAPMSFLALILITQECAPEIRNTTTFMCLGLFAILGHCYPVWLKFKGGKGFATTLGVLLAAVPYAGLAACLSWLLTAKITKYSSLSALVAVIVAPIATFFTYGNDPALVCLLITALVFWRHKDNIKRLRAGTESKIGQKKEDKG